MKPKQLAALLKAGGKANITPEMTGVGRHDKLKDLQRKVLEKLSEPDALKGEVDVWIDLLGVLDNEEMIWQSNKKLALNLMEQIMGYLDEEIDAPSVGAI